MFNFPYISREEAEALETTLIEQLNNSETNSKYYVFQVWGIGGVGKTTLTKKIAEDYNNIADFTIVSFGRTADIDNSIKLINVLYEQLPNNTFLSNKLFSNDPFKELYQKYWDTINELEKTPSEGKKEVDSEQQNLVKRLISEGASALAKSNPATAAVPETVVKKTAETAVDVGGIILSEADRVRQLLQQHKKTKDKRELKELMLEPLPKLTNAFLESCQQRKKPVILVLDTYEKVSPDIDAWVWKYLIGNAKFTDSNIYVIIAGRNNILKTESWRKLQQDTQLIYDRSLERFNEPQTTTYLQQIDIRDKSTIEQIFKITKGLPYYLDKIRERIKRGETIDFTQLNQDLFSVLLQGLNNTQKQVISMASCCRWFDKTLIKYLIDQQENLDFNTAVDEKLNCYQWLVKRDFVEYINGKYRLDDVARDVFKQEFWREDEPEFRQTHQQLADYFKNRRNKELFFNSSPAQQYNNPHWRDDTSEFLYHQLYAGTANSKSELISYLFMSCYFRQDEIVQSTVEQIIDEVDIYNDETKILIYPLKEFLQEITLIFFVIYFVFKGYSLDNKYFEEALEQKSNIFQTLIICFRQMLIYPLIEFQQEIIPEMLLLYWLLEKSTSSYEDYQEIVGQKSNIDKMITIYLNELTGISKISALLYKSKRCYPSQQLSYLQQAKIESEMIVTKDDPDFSCDLFLWDLGNNFYKLQAYQQAVDCFQIAVSFKPDYHEAWHYQGAALSNLKRFNEAIASYDKALELNSDYVYAWYNRGLALGNLKRFDEAIASYDKALELKPDLDVACYNRGIALGNLERFDEAIASYDKALELNPDHVYAWYNRGLALGNLKRFDEAIASYDKVLELNPDYVSVWYNRGLALANLKRFDEAIASYDKVLELNPDHVSAWNYRGNTLYNLAKFDEAIASYDKALELNPDYVYAWYNRGLALGNLKRFDEAIASYDKALELKPDLDVACYNRGIALGNLERFDEAIASYDKALELNPDHVYAWYNRGLALGNLKRFDEAIASYDKVLELNPDYVSVWYNRGLALANLKRFDEAIASYDKALELKPDYVYAWDNRGIALDKLRRFEDAIVSYDKALEFKPDDVYVWNARGAILCDKLKQYEQAFASFEKALEFKPDYHIAWYNRGIALRNLGRFKEAMSSFKKGQELKPDYYQEVLYQRLVDLFNLKRLKEVITRFLR
ncbi:tetratricopeptide repeat protein [Cyanothece sp. BG0011]|uniref:tetratricopeptide repeat protein n=1 Tax=Cyanothece sp. BG0011 TaxID=2082950 RepID=UPI001E2D7AAE|nr:tetratricopeptide repeat protein [Cyanothece sp. BG0011]